MKLYDHQLKALDRMKNGCILNGGVGSGKSLTSISYYYLQNGGSVEFLKEGEYIPMNDPPTDLYIITTAKKRDSMDWENEMSPFLLGEGGIYSNKVVVDSWNNITKYTEIKNSFFIFDEQRAIGSGSWAKSFIKIARRNKWILLSATPGDNWSDYIPVFIANGFFKNRTEFNREHVVFSSFTNFPKIERYLGTGKLLKLRKSILVDMDFDRDTIQHHCPMLVDYDQETYKWVGKERKNPYVKGLIPSTPDSDWSYMIGEDIKLGDFQPIDDIYEPREGDFVRLDYKPITNITELCYIWRRIVNSDYSRQFATLTLCKKHKRAIIFYNFDYELDILRELDYPDGTEIAEWNGHKHQEIPDSDRWVYLVQYTSGCEGWNCTSTDTIIFYSQNYSYKVMAQAAGRIDRLNSKYKDLYYYHLKSKAKIDLGINRALSQKKKFNESSFVKW